MIYEERDLLNARELHPFMYYFTCLPFYPLYFVLFYLIWRWSVLAYKEDPSSCIWLPTGLHFLLVSFLYIFALLSILLWLIRALVAVTAMLVAAIKEFVRTPTPTRRARVSEEIFLKIRGGIWKRGRERHTYIWRWERRTVMIEHLNVNSPFIVASYFATLLPLFLYCPLYFIAFLTSSPSALFFFFIIFFFCSSASCSCSCSFFLVFVPLPLPLLLFTLSYFPYFITSQVRCIFPASARVSGCPYILCP